MSKMILINGPSSVGKTSIARIIQDISEEKWVLFGIDCLLSLMPVGMCGAGGKAKEGLLIKPNENNVVTSEIGQFWRTLLILMPNLVKVFLNHGINVIVDEVITEDWVLNHYVSELLTHNVYFIGLYCLEVDKLMEREFLRLNRPKGLAISQIPHTDKYKRYYDLIVDTSSESLSSISNRIVDFIANNVAVGFDKIRQNGYL